MRRLLPWALAISPVTTGCAPGASPARRSGSPIELASPASTGTAALSPDLTVTAACVVVIWSALRSPGTAVTATVPVALLLPSLTVYCTVPVMPGRGLSPLIRSQRWPITVTWTPAFAALVVTGVAPVTPRIQPCGS